MAGPELVMPSIGEVSISEASWVAPAIQQAQASRSMRKRRKPPAPEETSQKGRQTGGGKETFEVNPHQKKRPRRLAQRVTSLYRVNDKLVRTTINGLLIAIILHLIALPEVVYQFQDACHIPAIKYLYPDSCVQLPTRPLSHNLLYPSNQIISPEDTIITSQQGLESIFEHAIQTLVPLSHLLRESETMLAELQDQLRSTFPEARHALDLEFQGGNQALITASWEFDSLRADLRSAVESLMASPPTYEQSGSPPSIARDTRVAAQIRRRAEYLDRLRSQIRSKADSLNARFSTLDDHLEAVDGIVAREERRGSMIGSTPAGGIQAGSAGINAVLSSLSNYASLGSGLWSKSTEDSSASGARSAASDPPIRGPGNSRPVTTLALLRIAATNHRPIADSVLRLSRQLRDAHGSRSASVW
ncbi:hypothetical protein N7470_003793 [Penicillium chermesinum]|nr:hypothetical protein N7470_003793 [Penicillium chermesinum]